MRCCVASPALIRIQSLFLLFRMARAETLRVTVGTPDDVPKKVKCSILLEFLG